MIVIFFDCSPKKVLEDSIEKTFKTSVFFNRGQGFLTKAAELNAKEGNGPVPDIGADFSYSLLTGTL